MSYSHTTKISDLIGQTNDPEKRAVLLVLAAIDDALERNTVATNLIATEMKEHREQFAQHREQFATHVHEEQTMLTGVKWGWWSATAMGSLILTLGGYLLVMQIAAMEKDSAQIKLNSIRLSVIESQIDDIRKDLLK